MQIVIPLIPITKKNHQCIIWNRKTNRPQVIPSKQYRDYEKACAEHIPQLPFAQYNCPVNVECLFYMPTRRRVDLVNLQESILDILVKYKVLEDDNSKIVVSMDGSRVLYDKANPRTVINITELF